MIRNFSKLFALAVLIVAAAMNPAKAATVALGLDTGWQNFTFGDVGSLWRTEYTFTLVDTATLNVTDAFEPGDRFSIFNNGTLLGNTSSVASSSTINVSDFGAAFADSSFSHGTFVLGAGTYDITGLTLDSPFGSGGAAIELVSGGTASAVPLPGSLPMYLAAVALLAAFAWRRKNLA